ncbi:MAG TPA: mechanosensitive ion channel domain-containing protein [Opitutus sp.]|nr:mechanosensitive ion channel domain-containing protein [Opitutus sp.]
MKRLFVLPGCLLALVLAVPALRADNPPAPAAQSATATAAPAPDDADAPNTTAAAVVGARPVVVLPRQPDFLEHIVDSILARFDVRNSGNSPERYAISAVFLIAAFLLRRIVTRIVFGALKRIARNTKTTLDDELFEALETPCAVLIMVAGIVGALQVLKLSATSDDALHYGSTIAFSLVIFWAVLRALDTLLDHAQVLAQQRQMSVAAFMPWIKKTLIAIFVVFGVLLVVQSLGYDVKALLAGLGIGGLAFALAAQDTLANVFGSIVVAIDQPFKLGEFVQIGANSGTVEDIGLRSTKLRRADQGLVVVPNKTVAAEAVLNLSRFIGRRADQVISLTYDTRREQMSGIVEDIRQILARESDVDQSSVLVFFRDFSASSLDVWMAYNTKNPDFVKHMTLRQRVNLEVMRAVEARGLAFAFPTQTVEFAGDIAQKIVEKK